MAETPIDRPSRRRLLGGAGLGLSTALAGCLVDATDQDESNDDADAETDSTADDDSDSTTDEDPDSTADDCGCPE
ncbi:hypothetical protein [Salinadaptatus halalkaliphilus]|uniref:hypothetical protein n=1 Tax=Salinadaptatus halalkaliphilus TaxID=2419781 RepID=UPI0011422B02|nr:hypothetical protein [Salinadaptatus halalkaliphilus]